MRTMLSQHFDTLRAVVAHFVDEQIDFLTIDSAIYFTLIRSISAKFDEIAVRIGDFIV